MPMIVMTTSNSTNVNARRRTQGGKLGDLGIRVPSFSQAAPESTLSINWGGGQ